MRYGIFSDIHGNLQAFEAVALAFQNEAIDKFFCVGDIIGYGANPHECIERTKEMEAVSIAGNHDWAVIDKIDLQYFNPMAKEAILWTKGHLAPEDMNYLKRLELLFTHEDFMMVHATLLESHYFHYLIDENQAKAMFRMMSKDIIFVGHTHIPGIYVEDRDRVEYFSSGTVSIKEGRKYIVNVGSVGQPRDGNPSSSYVVFDSTGKTVTIKRVTYDIEEAQRRILKAGLPPFLAFRLEMGQ